MSKAMDDAPQLPEVKVPWWQDGKTIADTLKEPHFLTEGVKSFLARVRGWLLFPLKQVDPLTCSEDLLSLVGWDRDIKRYTYESTELLRKRVAFASINSKDAGSTIGFKRIWQRMNIGFISIDERINGRDWDIVRLNVTESIVSGNQQLLEIILRTYGRTCRRYELSTITPLINNIRIINYNYESTCCIASE